MHGNDMKGCMVCLSKVEGRLEIKGVERRRGLVCGWVRGGMEGEVGRVFGGVRLGSDGDLWVFGGSVWGVRGRNGQLVGSIKY